MHSKNKVKYSTEPVEYYPARNYARNVIANSFYGFFGGMGVTAFTFWAISKLKTQHSIFWSLNKKITKNARVGSALWAGVLVSYVSAHQTAQNNYHDLVYNITVARREANLRAEKLLEEEPLPDGPQTNLGPEKAASHPSRSY